MGLSFSSETGSLSNVPALEARLRSPSILLRISQKINTCRNASITQCCFQSDVTQEDPSSWTKHMRFRRDGLTPVHN